MKITRRNALKIIGATPVAAGVALGEAAAAEQAMTHAGHVMPATPAHQAMAAKGPYKPTFFTAHEYATVTLLGDLIVPKDEKSGSASDAGVPQFIDFTMTDRPYHQTPMRGGLNWLDHESRERFGRAFIDTAVTEERVESGVGQRQQREAGPPQGVEPVAQVGKVTPIQDIHHRGESLVARAAQVSQVLAAAARQAS